MAGPTDIKREVLPLHIEPFVAEATSMTMDAYQRLRPYPVLIYTRTKLWDRSLLLVRSMGGGGQTQVARYDMYEGGMSFLQPIRKVQTDARHPGVVLGRATNQDMVVPVGSVSSAHCAFVPPQPNSPSWVITDLGSKNGTWLNEEQLQPKTPRPLKDYDGLRLGGNLIAWFFLPAKLWELLRQPDELKKYTEI